MSEICRHADLASPELKDLYFDLLKKTLTMTLWDARDGASPFPVKPTVKGTAIKAVKKVLGMPDRSLERAEEDRTEGRDWPRLAHTMIGMKRLDNVQFCVESVIRDGVPGDLIETGVWRGGACIFMRAILKAYGVKNRQVWVADSFAGLPPPDPSKYPADAGDTHHTIDVLAISIEDVKANFERYGMLDEQVRFLKGWFRDTLPAAPIERLAVVRLDGDMYESTMDGLQNLYPKLSLGGFLIVDDYGAVPACRRAVEDFRSKHGINEPIEQIDWGGVYWRRAQ